MSVINLTVHKNTKLKRERRSVWNRLQQMAKTAPKDIDGVAVIAFRHSSPNDLTVITDWSVRDAADAPRLPDIAATYLRKSQ